MSTKLDNAAPAAATEGGPTSQLRWLVSIEGAAGTAIEYIAALLVVAEIVVLFAGVVSRYVFHQPILWSDELASTLFLWLAMLGAVVALRRDEHMRMTAIVGMVSPPVRAFLDVLAVAAALAFLLLIVYPAYEFAHDETVVTTPALEISNAWRASALPIGSALMLLIALMRLLEVSNWRLVGGAVAVVAVGIAIGNPDEGIRPIIGYMLALVFGLIVVAAVPWISIGFLE